MAPSLSKVEYRLPATEGHWAAAQLICSWVNNQLGVVVAGKMAQWVKVFAIKLDHLRPFPGTHLVGGETQFLHIMVMVLIHVYTDANKYMYKIE